MNFNLTDALVAETHQRDSLTANGAVTHSTTLNAVLDLFFLAGASRTMDVSAIQNMFGAAFAQDPELTMKVVFWARDIRGGAGERRFFRICLKELYTISQYSTAAREAFSAIMLQIPEYGTWKDAWETWSSKEPGKPFVQKVEGARKPRVRPTTKLIQEDVPLGIAHLVRDGILADPMDPLLAKWLPTQGLFFELMVEMTGIGKKSLRRRIRDHRKVVEQQMSAGDFEGINYSHVPGVAMKRYLKAFKRNDEARFDMFISDVNEGKETMHAGTIYPHDIVSRIRNGENDLHDALTAQWRSLDRPEIASGRRMIAVSDVSASMTFDQCATGVSPIDVSIAMGLYFAEQISGPFKDVLVTFSDQPKVIRLAGEIPQRVAQVKDRHMGTNLQAVFETILKVAQAGGATEAEMPDVVLILSDMEFNSVRSGEEVSSDYWASPSPVTNLDAIRAMYATSGYQMPDIVFWNLNGRTGNAPAQATDPGVALLSGFSPQIAQGVLEGKVVSPMETMLKVLSQERYARIKW